MNKKFFRISKLFAINQQKIGENCTLPVTILDPAIRTFLFQTNLGKELKARMAMAVSILVTGNAVNHFFVISLVLNKSF